METNPAATGTAGDASAGDVSTAVITGNIEAHGTVIFRPLEAKFVINKDPSVRVDPYCKFKIGWHSGRSSVAKAEGVNPSWESDAIELDRMHNEMYAQLKVKDRKRKSLTDNLGKARISLDDIITRGKVTQWYSLYHKDTVSGEILIDAEFRAK